MAFSGQYMQSPFGASGLIDTSSMKGTTDREDFRGAVQQRRNRKLGQRVVKQQGEVQKCIDGNSLSVCGDAARGIACDSSMTDRESLCGPNNFLVTRVGRQIMGDEEPLAVRARSVVGDFPVRKNIGREGSLQLGHFIQRNEALCNTRGIMCGEAIEPDQLAFDDSGKAVNVVDTRYQDAIFFE